MRSSPWMGPARPVLLLVVMVALATAGCSRSTATVSGTINFKGAPLKGGTVLFVNEDGTTVSATIGEDGKYTIRNIHPGPVQIAVKTAFLRPNDKAPASKHPYKLVNPPADQEGQPIQRGHDPTANAKRFVAIPPHYEELDTSGLTYTVEPGNQTHDLDLHD